MMEMVNSCRIDLNAFVMLPCVEIRSALRFVSRHQTVSMAAATFVEPSCHSYLGNQLRDARKKQPFNINPDATYTVLLVALPDVVLFPGETIPLRLQHQELVTRIEQIMQMSGGETEDQQFIGVLSVLPGRQGRSTLASFGTTVEVNSSHRARMESRQLHHDEEHRQEMIVIPPEKSTER